MVRVLGVLTVIAMSCGTAPVAPADPCDDTDAGRLAAEEFCRCPADQQRRFYCYLPTPDAGRSTVCLCVERPDAGP